MVRVDTEARQPLTQEYRLFEPLTALRNAEDGLSYYSSEENCQSILDLIKGFFLCRGIYVLSMDVFDTALLRESKSEARRFWELSDRFARNCQESGSDSGFDTLDAFLSRTLAAKAAYNISPITFDYIEGKFDDIARITCQLLNRPDLVEHYIRNEIEYEFNSLTVNPILKAIYDMWPHIEMIFVSDMYLESNKIEQLLQRKGIQINSKNKVFSSAEGLGCKRNGSIFKVVEERLGVSGSHLLHLGDSLRSDYQMAKIHGWNSLYLPIPDRVKSIRRQCYDSLSHDLSSYGITLQNYISFNY